METVDIKEVVKTTAKNMYEMLLQLAAHIETIELENARLKELLKVYTHEIK
jgi:hypothetical protein